MYVNIISNAPLLIPLDSKYVHLHKELIKNITLHLLIISILKKILYPYKYFGK